MLKNMAFFAFAFVVALLGGLQVTPAFAQDTSNLILETTLPETTRVGEKVTFQVVVTNSGDTTETLTSKIKLEKSVFQVGTVEFSPSPGTIYGIYCLPNDCRHTWAGEIPPQASATLTITFSVSNVTGEQDFLWVSLPGMDLIKSLNILPVEGTAGGISQLFLPLTKSS